MQPQRNTLEVVGHQERRLLELVGADPSVSFSPHCWKTKMALAHKGLDATMVPLHFSDIEKTDLRDARTLPVLFDGNRTVSDSWEIAMYLEGRYDRGGPLFGEPLVIFFTRAINAWVDEIVLPALSKVLSKDIWNCIDEADRPYYRASREARFGHKLEDVWSARDTNLKLFRELVDPLRQKIAGQDYIGAILDGSSPRYADYCAFAPFMWARCVSPIELLELGDPIAPWRDRLLDAFGGMARQAPTFRS
jgi:glutathione S-transferase